VSHRQELQAKLLDFALDKKLPYDEQKRRYGEALFVLTKLLT
jgi:hypothetical protein